MRLLSYLNISNIDDIESDSGYIFNYTLSNELALRGIEYYMVHMQEETITTNIHKKFKMKMFTIIIIHLVIIE